MVSRLYVIVSRLWVVGGRLQVVGGRLQHVPIPYILIMPQNTPAHAMSALPLP